jgi:hypothetical protein
MGMKSDRNILSTMDLKLFENFRKDAIWRTAIPYESHEAIAVIQDARVRGGLPDRARKPTTPCRKLEGVNGALTR